MVAVTGRRPLVAVSFESDVGDRVDPGGGHPVLAAGGLLVQLPLYVEEVHRADLLDRIDGLLVAGGRDIAPRRGRPEPPLTQGQTSPRPDETEMSYVRLAVEKEVPLLGSGRGCQLLNVAFGGTLRGASTLGGDLETGERHEHPAHRIDVRPGSMLEAHLGQQAVVGSSRGQAIDQLGQGLNAVAWAPDGAIEAIEMPGAPAFVLGIRWELNDKWQTDLPPEALWGAFVEAARRRATQRPNAGAEVTASIEVTMDAVDVETTVAFWQAALGYERMYDRDPFVVLGPPAGDYRPRVLVQRVDALPAGKAPVHLDLRVDDPEAEVARLVRLGATVRWEVDERERGGSHWTTLADPQGALFCVCPARSESEREDPPTSSRLTDSPPL